MFLGVHMVMLNINIEEVERLRESLKEIINYSKKYNEYKNSLRTDSNNYQVVKNHLSSYCKFLQYMEQMEPGYFFRIRSLTSEKPFKNNQDLNYKERDINSIGRMNNPLINTLYTSLSAQTAMFESNLQEDQIVQLAIFQTKEKIKVYKLGTFAEIYFGKALNSEEQKRLFKRYLNEEKPNESQIRGLIALETVLVEFLYSDDSNDYIITALIADSIFSANKERIDAIVYPSKKHKFGVNIAFKEEYAKKLKVKYSQVLKIKKRYETGFMMFQELSFCKNCEVEDEWEFEESEEDMKIHRPFRG